MFISSYKGKNIGDYSFLKWKEQQQQAKVEQPMVTGFKRREELPMVIRYFYLKSNENIIDWEIGLNFLFSISTKKLKTKQLPIKSVYG